MTEYGYPRVNVSNAVFLGPLTAPVDTAAPHALANLEAGAALGASVSTVPSSEEDISSGIRMMAVGAPGDSTSGEGSVYLLTIGPAGEYLGSQVLRAPTGVASGTLRFGASVAAAGVDPESSLPILAIGAPGGHNGIGSVHIVVILSESRTFGVSVGDVTDNLAGGGAGVGAAVGTAVAGLGLVRHQDGETTLAIAATAPGNGTFAGDFGGALYMRPLMLNIDDETGFIYEATGNWQPVLRPGSEASFLDMPLAVGNATGSIMGRSLAVGPVEWTGPGETAHSPTFLDSAYRWSLLVGATAGTGQGTNGSAVGVQTIDIPSTGEDHRGPTWSLAAPADAQGAGTAPWEPQVHACGLCDARPQPMPLPSESGIPELASVGQFPSAGDCATSSGRSFAESSCGDTRLASAGCAVASDPQAAQLPAYYA